MTKYIIRLDDACPFRDIGKWNRVEQLLDKYDVKPLVGIIPDCKDPDLIIYPEDTDFWTNKINSWKSKKWTLALHGYNHIFTTKQGGINPVNSRSEFAGESLDKQKEKIRNALSILRNYGVYPNVFFAPAHTFDLNTIEALKQESDIRIISDTPANNVYFRYGMTFVPQQSGRVRKLPFKIVTFCYHPNNMKDIDFEQLEKFLKEYSFIDFPLINPHRKLSFFDIVLMKIYYWRHK